MLGEAAKPAAACCHHSKGGVCLKHSPAMQIIPPAAQFVPQQLSQIVANKPDVTSPAFSNQFVAVEQFGQLNGTVATKYQQQTATFWADSDNTAAITGHL